MGLHAEQFVFACSEHGADMCVPGAHWAVHGTMTASLNAAHALDAYVLPRLACEHSVDTHPCHYSSATAAARPHG